MSYTVKRKRGSRIYLYEVTSVPDEKSGKPKKHYRYLGIFDPATENVSAPRKEKWSGNGGSSSGRKPALKAIARASAYSVSTVCKALKKDTRISSEAAEVIRETAAKMGWRPPAANQKYPILVVLPESRVIFDQYTIMLLNPLKEAVAQSGNSLIFCSADKLDGVDIRCISGVISIDYVRNLARFFPDKLTVPAVCLNDYSNSYEHIYAIVSDENSAFLSAVEHFWSLGHRKLALIQAQSTYCAKLRQQAFTEQVRRLGMDGMTFDFNELGFGGAVSEACRRGCSGIILPGESELLPFLKAVKRLGLKVPEDISAVIWESRFAGVIEPEYTSCEQDFKKMAAAAVDMIRRLQNNESGLTDIRIPYKFNLRRSVRKIG
ncbi:MAG: LacI family DNA-binding transcriptional regulator [Lentisphaeria bacterium]|nr:LacI family DNA-binding transcriptional regulator [Lentisphaeria bacterium]